MIYDKIMEKNQPMGTYGRTGPLVRTIDQQEQRIRKLDLFLATKEMTYGLNITIITDYADLNHDRKRRAAHYKGPET